MTRGAYALLVHVPYPMSLAIGGLGNIDFKAGYYAYIGSALGGLEKRVGRHLKPEKKVHWHIDHFLLRARAVDVILAESKERVECVLARELSKQLQCVKGFGCSDCDCESHLFYNQDLHSLVNSVVKVFKSSGLKPKRGLEYE